MSTLSEIIGTASAGVKLQVKGVENSVRIGINATLQNATQAVTNRVINTAGTILNEGVRGVIGAGADVMKGDFSGALTQLGGITSDIGSTISSVLGLGGGATLTSPGADGAQMFQASSSNGIEGGNAYAGISIRPDPLMSFLWFTELPVLTPTSGPAQGLPWYYVEEANLPFRTLEPRPIFREGRNQHYPGTYSVDSLRLAIYGDVNNEALTYLQTWQDLILSPTTSKNASRLGGGFGRPNSFRKSIKTYLLSPAKQQLCVVEYTNCWPQTIEAYSLNSASSERIVNHVMFSVDDVFLTRYNVSSTALLGFLGSGANFASNIQQTITSAAGNLATSAFQAVSTKFGGMFSSSSDSQSNDILDSLSS